MSDDINIYKYAAQNKLTFPSRRGELTVEQLFDLPLLSPTGNGFDLETVAQGIDEQLETTGKRSFVNRANAANSKQKALTVALEIVQDVIATKEAANKAAQDRVEKAATRKKLVELLNSKKEEKLKELTPEEIEKQLADLDG